MVRKKERREGGAIGIQVMGRDFRGVVEVPRSGLRCKVDECRSLLCRRLGPRIALPPLYRALYTAVGKKGFKSTERHVVQRLVAQLGGTMREAAGRRIAETLGTRQTIGMIASARKCNDGRSAPPVWRLARRSRRAGQRLAKCCTRCPRQNHGVSSPAAAV